ncbi:hemolysin family protein [bacterium]|nr:hemolysin family protein [bacterium]
MAILYLNLSLLFLVFSLILYALHSALEPLSKKELEELLERKSTAPLKKIKKSLKNSSAALSHLLTLTTLLVFTLFLASILVFFSATNLALDIEKGVSQSFTNYFYLLIAAVLIGVSTLEFFTLAKVITSYCSKGTIKALSIIGSIPIYLFFPLTYPTLLLGQKLSQKRKLPAERDLIKSKLLEIANEESHPGIDPMKKRLIQSLAHFDEKTCREIMVPRIRMECLENTSSIFEALTLFIDEGYSRIPIYEKSIDHITGMLLYKDVLEYTFKRGMKDIETIQKAPIASLVTPILYAPENKQISELFQVMHTRKIHATIVVNEYGCTEGLVTIEDIFEELIGSEILDEHDEEDDLMYKKTHDKGWIIEADLSIIDAEREFGIALPHDKEYETIGGFISSTLGSIPKAGTTIHFNQYEIKVLSSTERKILKVKISISTPAVAGEK